MLLSYLQPWLAGWYGDLRRSWPERTGRRDNRH
jgi:hypothetical protein